MKFKNILFFTIILLAIFSVSAVSAEDIANDNGVNIIGDNVGSSDIISSDIGDEKLIGENINEVNEVVGNSSDVTNQSSIKSNDLTKYYKNDSQYEASFFDSEGNPLVNQIIPININGKDYNRTTDASGAISFAINLMPGNYIIKVINPVTKETALNNITVLSTMIANDIVKTYKNATQYSITLLNGQGKPDANAKVIFNIHGVFYERVANVKGVASLNINLNPGNYVLTAYNELGLQISNKITVLSSINGKDIKKYHKNATQYYANFTDKKGKALANTNVTFNINGVFYNRVTNENGTAQLNINLDPGKYVLTAINPVTSEQKANIVEVLNKIVVKNSASGGNISMEYNSGAKYTVTLYQGNGSVAKNKNIKFNINGVMYTRTSDENGTASLNINLRPGDYVITGEFDGCWVSNLIKVRITPTVSVVSTTLKYGEPLKFYLKEKNSGNPITGQHYGIILYNNTPYGAFPDANGLVQIGQYFPVGFSQLIYFGMIDDGYYSSIWNGNTVKIVA